MSQSGVVFNFAGTRKRTQNEANFKGRTQKAEYRMKKQNQFCLAPRAGLGVG